MGNNGNILPPGWHVDEKTGHIVRDTIHHMGRRCRNWDYCGRGCYLITITLADRSRPLPSGRLFDLCSEGRLLLLAPGGWPFLPGEKKMTREDACVLNRIAQILAGTGAAEINSRGVTPAGVDKLVAEATTVKEENA